MLFFALQLRVQMTEALLNAKKTEALLLAQNEMKFMMIGIVAYLFFWVIFWIIKGKK